MTVVNAVSGNAKVIEVPFAKIDSKHLLSPSEKSSFKIQNLNVTEMTYRNFKVILPNKQQFEIY